MPNIPEYDQPNIAIRPNETGTEAMAAAGRRGAAFYNQAGERLGAALRNAGDTAVDYLDHQQINAGMEHGSALTVNLTDSWNKTAASADPYDPATAAKWRAETFEPAAQQFLQGFVTEKGQQWAETYVNNLRQHFYQKTEADMSSLAGIAVDTTVRNIGNRFSNTAMDDPSAVPMMLNQVDHSIDGIIGANPNIKGATAAKVKLEVGEKIKEQIVKAGAYGAISNAADPVVAAEAWSRQYPDYINGEEERTIARAAQVQNHANLAMAKQAELYQKQIDNLKVEAGRNKIWSDNVSIDAATGKTTIKPDFFKQIVQLPGQYPHAANAVETAKTLLQWGEEQQKREVVPHDDHAAVDNLLNNVVANPNLSASDAKMAILKSDTASPMTSRTRADLIQLTEDMRNLNDPLLTQDMAAAKELVEPKFGGINSNPGAYAKFYYDFIHNQYVPARMAGKLQPNALDMNDPQSMISQAITKATGGPEVTVPAAVRANGGIGAPLPVYMAPGKAAQLPTIIDKAAYDKLAPGAAFLDQHGKRWTKPQSEAPMLQPGQS